MKVGTAMDFNPDRRGRGQGYFFDPTRVELVEIDVTEGDEEEVDPAPPNLEPEPDDPDADQSAA